MPLNVSPSKTMNEKPWSSCKEDMIAIECHIMCHVLFYVTNFFATCLKRLNIDIYDLKLVINI